MSAINYSTEAVVSDVIKGSTDYLGKGYDLVLFAPYGENSLEITGQKGQVFQVAHNLVGPGNESYWREYVHWIASESSTFSSEIKVIKTEHSANESLSYDFGLSASLGEVASGKNSFGYTMEMQKTLKKGYTLGYSMAKAYFGMASLKNYNHDGPGSNEEKYRQDSILNLPELTAQFKVDAEKLIRSANPDYKSFIKIYGTHFSAWVKYGGSQIRKYTFTDRQLDQAISQGVSFSGEGKATIEGVTIGGSQSVNYNSSHSSYLQNIGVTIDIRSVGTPSLVKVTEEGNGSEKIEVDWNSASGQGMPVAFDFVRISELFVKENFEYLHNDHLEATKRGLEKAIQEYFEYCLISIGERENLVPVYEYELDGNADYKLYLPTCKPEVSFKTSMNDFQWNSEPGHSTSLNVTLKYRPRRFAFYALDPGVNIADERLYKMHLFTSKFLKGSTLLLGAEDFDQNETLYNRLTPLSDPLFQFYGLVEPNSQQKLLYKRLTYSSPIDSFPNQSYDGKTYNTNYLGCAVQYSIDKLLSSHGNMAYKTFTCPKPNFKGAKLTSEQWLLS